MSHPVPAIFLLGLLAFVGGSSASFVLLRDEAQNCEAQAIQAGAWGSINVFSGACVYHVSPSASSNDTTVYYNVRLEGLNSQ